MKIVLFDYIFERDKPGITGLSDLVWNWARQLVQFGDEVHIIAPYPENVKAPEGTIIHRFPVPPVGYRNIIGHFLIVLRGWMEIRRLGKVDIIHAPEYFSTGLLSFLIRNAPVILTVPGNIYERVAHGNPFDWMTTQAFKIAAKLSARFCACIITTSEEMRWWWGRTGTPESRMVDLPYGVDIHTFYPVPHARDLLGTCGDKRVILYVGRLSHEKGILQLMEATFPLIENDPTVELHLIGDGPLRPRLRQWVKDRGIDRQVVFHGWINQFDLPIYYSAADVTVLPSLSEGLPRTMLEAMACGCLFLGTKITGIVDHIHDGETGFLIPPGDPGALEEKLTYVLNHNQVANKVALQGYDYVCRSLSWENIVRRIREEVYLTV